ncbi:MAG: hypothetical protein ACO38V_01770 [Phycisphaerales bacterium]
MVVASDGYDLFAPPEEESCDAAEGRIGLRSCGEGRVLATPSYT